MMVVFLLGGFLSVTVASRGRAAVERPWVAGGGATDGIPAPRAAGGPQREGTDPDSRRGAARRSRDPLAGRRRFGAGLASHRGVVARSTGERAEGGADLRIEAAAGPPEGVPRHAPDWLRLPRTTRGPGRQPVTGACPASRAASAGGGRVAATPSAGAVARPGPPRLRGRAVRARRHRAAGGHAA